MKRIRNRVVKIIFLALVIVMALHIPPKIITGQNIGLARVEAVGGQYTGIKLPFTSGQTRTVSGTHNRSTNNGRHAIDFSMRTENVLAIRSGTVTFRGWDNAGGGNVLVIDHGDGFCSAYMHLSQFHVAVSNNIRQGQLIAVSGNTGISTGPHLHVEVTQKLNGKCDLAAAGNNANGEIAMIFDEVGRELNYGDQVTSQNTGTVGQIAAMTNLITNGTFGNGTTGWQFAGDIDHTITSNGHLGFKTRAGGQSAIVYQDLNVSTPANTPIEVIWQMGNPSNVTKQYTVYFHSGESLANIRSCSFSIPPNTGIQYYSMRFQTAQYANMRINFIEATKDGVPDLWLDDVWAMYLPGLNAPVQECVSPATNPNWDFTQGTANWIGGHSISNGEASSNGYRFNITGNDPWIQSPALTNVNANDYRYAIIEMVSNTSNEAQGQVYFRAPGSLWFDAAYHVPFTIIPNGQMQTYIVDMKSNPLWQNAILQLRVDVAADSAQGNVQVKNIRLTNTLPPVQTTLGLRAVATSNPVTIGNTVTVDILLDAPQTAPGGGVYALENVCTVSPAGVLDGQTVTAGTLFQPDPVTINQGFQADDSHTYATSQSGSNPPISTGGVVYTLTFSAIGAGEATLDCDSQMIDANGVQGPLPFTGVKITVQQPPPTTGIVAGSVGRSHATDAGITVTLLDSNQNVVATATTQNDGTFLMPDIPAGTYVIRASTLGHLPAQGNVTVVAGQTAQMQAVVLPAGEIITAGNVIDELDVVQLAINYGKSVPPADAAADFDLSGSINLTDLRALAQHLRMTGPISWGQ